MDKITIPKFLKNNPIGEDLFEGKSQDKIASVLTNVLKDDNFQIIGIDGAWGSGKSNLVGIINKKLSEHIFFIYDVWGHQEDDQRKAILVELTEFISSAENNLVSDKDKWNEKLKRLLSKEKEVTTINRPYLSIGFILSLVLIIYVPTINTFAKGDEDFYGIDNFFWKLILVLFPLFLILIIYFSKVFYQIFYTKNKWKCFKIALQETFQVYNNKQLDETKIETISENEPSVKDFRNWMKEIDQDLGKKKLIIVFDNFDRLPKKNILSIWSSIHIFFAEEKYKNIKVIIPFDRLHIKNAFSELNGTNVKTDFANDYINKTFDLVYRVSLPILSDWKTFFKARWTEAFTEIDENEYLKVEQIYEIYRPIITPREMISCINEIVSIKLLDNSIPERYIALFVLNKEIIIEDPLKAIINGDFLKGLSYLYLDDEDFQKYITALAYQINPDSALEVAYKKQLKESLVNKDIEKFTEISKTNIFHKIVVATINEIENFENPILTLDSLTVDGKISTIEKQLVWDTIYLKIKDVSHDIFDILDYQKIIIKHINLVQSTRWVSLIISKLRGTENFIPITFAKLIDDLDLFLKQNSLHVDVFEMINDMVLKKTEADLFTKLVVEKKSDYLKYNITVDTERLNNFLISLPTIALDNAEYIKYLKSDFNLNSFINEISERIVSDIDEPQSVKTLYNRLKEVSEKPITLELEDSHLYDLFKNFDETEEFYYDIISMRLSKLNSFNTSYDSLFETILNSESDTIADKVAERIEYFIKFDDFLIGSKSFTSSILYKNVAKKLVTNEYVRTYSNLKEILENFDHICINTGIEPAVFLLNLNNWNSNVLEYKFVENFPLFLFQQAIKDDSSLAKKLVDLANEYFTSLNKTEWLSIYGDFQNFKYKLIKIIYFQNWNSYSSEALKEVLTDSITAKNLKNSEEWSYLFTSFKKANVSLINTFKDIRDKFYNDSSLVNKNSFTLLLDQFIELSILNDKPGDAFRTFFKVEYLDDIELLNLLISHSNEVKELIKKSSSNDVSDFKNGITARMESNELIKNLANKLEIKLTKK